MGTPADDLHEAIYQWQKRIENEQSMWRSIEESQFSEDMTTYACGALLHTSEVLHDLAVALKMYRARN